MSSSEIHLDGSIDQMSGTTRDALNPENDIVVFGTIKVRTKGSIFPTAWYDGFQGWWSTLEEQDNGPSFEPFELNKQ
jgi:hypothetical protein